MPIYQVILDLVMFRKNTNHLYVSIYIIYIHIFMCIFVHFYTNAWKLSLVYIMIYNAIIFTYLYIYNVCFVCNIIELWIKNTVFKRLRECDIFYLFYFILLLLYLRRLFSKESQKWSGFGWIGWIGGTGMGRGRRKHIYDILHMKNLFSIKGLKRLFDIAFEVHHCSVCSVLSRALVHSPITQ